MCICCRFVPLSCRPWQLFVVPRPAGMPVHDGALEGDLNPAYISALAALAGAIIGGLYKGRPISIDAAQIRQLRAELGPAAIAKRLGIARSSVYRALA